MANDGTLNFNTSLDTSGINTGLSKIGNIASTSLKFTGAILTGAATAIGGLGAAAIKAGSDFEAQMDKVAAISGATEDEFRQLCDIAKEMGATTKFTATEAGQGLEYMAMAGWKTKDSIAALPAVLNLAAAAGEDLGTTSDIVTDAMTAFKMEAGEASHFADVLAAASSNANTNVSMMGETFKYVAPIAGTLGYNIEDTALAIGLMANSGIKASQAGTSLRSALTRMADPKNEEMVSTMVKLGLATQQTAHVIDGAKIDKLQGQIADKTASMQKAQISYNSAVAKYGASSAQAQKAAISLETAKRKLADTTGKLGAAQAGTNSVIGITNTLMTDGKGNMNSLESVILQLRKSFKNLTQEEQAQAATTLFGQEAMSGMLAIINASDADFEKLSGAIKDCNGSAAEMAAIMQDNLPGQIVILQSGLEGLGISIYESVEEPLKETVIMAQEWVNQLHDAFKEGGFEGLISEAGDVIAQIAQKIAESSPLLINAAVELISSFKESLFQNREDISSAGAELITALIEGLASAQEDIMILIIAIGSDILAKIAESSPEIVSAVVTAVTNITEALADYSPDFLQAGIDILFALISGITEAIPTLATHAAVILQNLCEALVQNLPMLADAALQLAQALAEGLVEASPLLLEGAIDLLMGIVEALPVIIERLLQALPELITTIIDFFVTNIPLIIDGAIQLLMGIIEAIPDIIQAIVENLPQIITAIIDGLVGATPQLVEASITLLLALIDAIPEIVAAITENMPQIISAIAAGLADAMPTIFTAGRDLLWNVITAIPEVVAGLATAVPDIIAGIVNGLVGGVGEVFDAAVELGGGILDGIKSFFGIQSPSTVMEEQGGYLVEGMINGLADLPNRAMEAISGVLDNILAWGAELSSSGLSAATEFVNSVVSSVQELPTKIWTWLVDVVTRVTTWAVNIRTEAVSAATGLVNGVIEQVSQLPTKVWTWLVGVVNKITVWRTNLIEKGKAAAEGLCTAVIDGVKGLPDKMAEIGDNIVTGIWDGISSGWEWLTDKIKGLASDLLETAKNALIIGSPSKAFKMEVGRWIPPGISSGISMAMPSAISDLEDEMGSLVAKAQASISFDTIKTAAPIVNSANARAEKAETVINNYDYSTDINNEFNVPVVSAAEISKADRQTARKIYGGVK